jgi:hypothetical protein
MPGKADQMIAGLSPLEELKKPLRLWWLIFLLTLIGAFLGWCLHFLRPPVYEARATFVVSVDYSRVRVLNEEETDFSVNDASYILTSAEVVDRVAARLQQVGLPVGVEDLDRMYSRERRETAIIIYIRGSDRSFVDQVAAIWAEEATRVIETAYHHAVYADYLARVSLRTQGRLENLFRTTPGSVSARKMSEILQQAFAFNELLVKERQASMNLFPGLTISFNGLETSSGDPVYFNVGTFTLCGGLIGLVIGTIFCLTGAPRLIIKKK